MEEQKQPDRELVENIKTALKSGIADVNVNAVNLEDFTSALKTATLEVLKETVPDFEMTVRKYIEQYPDAWLVAEDQKQFYIVRPLSRLELKKLSKSAATDEDLADLVISTCVVYPKMDVEKILNLKAGTAKNLLDTIMTISNFNGAMPVVKL